MSATAAGPKQNRGNRTARTPAQVAALQRGRKAPPWTNIQRRVTGLAYARRYREGRPFLELLDSIYGPAIRAATAPYPFHGHRTCAEWGGE